jgi:hypothetical protein
MRASVAGLVVGVLAAGAASAQYVISAHSGVVQYVEGTAFLNDNPVEPKAGQFPDVKENQIFRTEQGQAEILLTPGVFLRLGQDSSIRMASNKLSDTRVEVLGGSAMVECDDLAKDNAIMLLYKANSILLVKRGLYRVDSVPGVFKVYDGEAIVKGESGQVTLHKGKQTLLNGALMAENFDVKADDELYRWSDRRSGYLAKANISSATSLSSSYAGYGYGWSGWQFNPMFGLYTFVPYDGYMFSPFGYGFWSPYTVWQAPIYYYGGGGGGSGGPSPTRTTSGSGKHAPYMPGRNASGGTRGGGGAVAHGGGGGFAHGGSAVSAASSGSIGGGHASGGGGHR